MKKAILTLTLSLPLLLPLPAIAAYDMKGVELGATESDVKRMLPSAHCKALEWKSKAADRRCDDSRVLFGGVEVRVTLYLRKDAVEAFDVRFDTKELDRFVALPEDALRRPGLGEPRYLPDQRQDRAPGVQGALGEGRRARRPHRAAREAQRLDAGVARQIRRRDLPRAVGIRGQGPNSLFFKVSISSEPRSRAPGPRRCRRRCS